MPDLAQWALLAAIGLAVGVAIAWPLLRPRASGSIPFDTRAEAEARALRHRVALEALLDVEADRRAGSLDDASYERERAEAEARAAETLGQSRSVQALPGPASSAPRNVRGIVAWLGAAVAAAVLVGFALAGPAGLAERTVVNQALADELAQETDRQADIQRLLGLLAADPQDAQVLSDLADAYLAGSGAEDLQRAAVALQVLLAVEPENHSAYRRLITAYITAADWADARAATDSYAGIAADQPDIPFFRGLIALRADDGTAEAIRQFDLFLHLAPDDPRASMVRSLRADAVGELSGASPSSAG